MSRPDIRLLALDLDGTLLTSENQLSALTCARLKAATQRDVHVILITTRRFAGTLAFYHQLELQTPLVCANGAQVWASADGPLWAEHGIDPTAARAIAHLADTHNWELGISYGTMSYWRQRPGQSPGPLTPDITIVATNADAVSDHALATNQGAPLRILTWHPHAIATLEAYCHAELTAYCVTARYENQAGEAQSLGIFAPQANKGAALQLVMTRLGIPRQHVASVGDNFNDLPMFAQSGTSIAMANAPQPVRQQATLIAPSNDHEGIAWVVETLGLA